MIPNVGPFTKKYHQKLHFWLTPRLFLYCFSFDRLWNNEKRPRDHDGYSKTKIIQL